MTYSSADKTGVKAKGMEVFCLSGRDSGRNTRFIFLRQSNVGAQPSRAVLRKMLNAALHFTCDQRR